jgi:hypothetical protein
MRCSEGCCLAEQGAAQLSRYSVVQQGAALLRRVPPLSSEGHISSVAQKVQEVQCSSAGCSELSRVQSSSEVRRLAQKGVA